MGLGKSLLGFFKILPTAIPFSALPGQNIALVGAIYCPSLTRKDCIHQEKKSKPE